MVLWANTLSPPHGMLHMDKCSCERPALLLYTQLKHYSFVTSCVDSCVRDCGPVLSVSSTRSSIYNMLVCSCYSPGSPLNILKVDSSGVSVTLGGFNPKTLIDRLMKWGGGGGGGACCPCLHHCIYICT